MQTAAGVQELESSEPLRHFEAKPPGLKDKPPEYFERKKQEREEQKKLLVAATSINVIALRATKSTRIKDNFLFFPSCSSGGKTYDKDHVVIMPENEERLSQQWEIELL